MEISKRSTPQTECHDRLSELPDSLIFHILWFVPMEDVVRTTLLSKRWENRWTTTPFLNFDKQSDNLKGFQNFVNRALLCWNGIRVLKFKVLVKYDELYDSINSDAALWVNFAKGKGVEELYLQFELNGFFCDYDDDVGDLFMVARCLYSCSSLKVLSLSACNFRMIGTVHWSQLKSLTVTECFGVTEELIDRILSGSPLLEVLNLSFVDRGDSLSIVSDSLKELRICKSLYCRELLDEATQHSELTIRTPNLETLEITGFPYSNCRLLDVSSLTSATIGFYGLIYDEQFESDEFDENGLEDHISSVRDCIADNVRQAVQTIQHVQNVSLSFCCLKGLRAMKMRCMHSSFPNVKSLKIGRCYDNYEQIVGLLDIFPELERLVLEGKEGRYLKDDTETVEDEANLPESFLPQLRTIEVIWKEGDSIFTALETLLKYASKMDQLVFQVKEILPTNSLLSAVKKLKNMPRSSANCQIRLRAHPWKYYRSVFANLGLTRTCSGINSRV